MRFDVSKGNFYGYSVWMRDGARKVEMIDLDLNRSKRWARAREALICFLWSNNHWKKVKESRAKLGRISDKRRHVCPKNKSHERDLKDVFQTPWMMADLSGGRRSAFYIRSLYKSVSGVQYRECVAEVSYYKILRDELSARRTLNYFDICGGFAAPYHY